SSSSGSAMSVAPGQADRGIGECRDAFAAPGETELLAGGRLPSHPRHRNAGDLGDPGAHGVAMRANARRLAHDSDVEMGNAPATRLDPLDREGKEAVGRSAAPLRIARREVHADVAFAERAQNGIG